MLSPFFVSLVAATRNPSTSNSRTTVTVPTVLSPVPLCRGGDSPGCSLGRYVGVAVGITIPMSPGRGSTVLLLLALGLSRTLADALPSSTVIRTNQGSNDSMQYGKYGNKINSKNSSFLKNMTQEIIKDKAGAATKENNKSDVRSTRPVFQAPASATTIENSNVRSTKPVFQIPATNNAMTQPTYSQPSNIQLHSQFQQQIQQIDPTLEAQVKAQNNPLLKQATSATITILFIMLLWRSLSAYELADQFSTEYIRLMAVLPTIGLLCSNLIAFFTALTRPNNLNKNLLKTILAANIIREYIELAYNAIMLVLNNPTAQVPREIYFGRFFGNVWWLLLTSSFSKTRWTLSQFQKPLEHTTNMSDVNFSQQYPLDENDNADY